MGFFLGFGLSKFFIYIPFYILFQIFSVKNKLLRLSKTEKEGLHRQQDISG